MTGSTAGNGSRLARMAALIGEDESAGIDLAASSEERLDRRAQTTHLRFGFRFDDRSFDAEAVVTPGRAEINFVGAFGVLPFSQEDRGRRELILTTLARFRQAGLTCTIGHNQAVRVGGSVVLDGVSAPREMLAAIIERLVAARHRLEELSALAYTPAPRRR